MQFFFNQPLQIYPFLSNPIRRQLASFVKSGEALWQYTETTERYTATMLYIYIYYPTATANHLPYTYRSPPPSWWGASEPQLCCAWTPLEDYEVPPYLPAYIHTGQSAAWQTPFTQIIVVWWSTLVVWDPLKSHTTTAPGGDNSTLGAEGTLCRNVNLKGNFLCVSDDL